ncbi:MAG: tyrosine-type recombinase/integrase [Verrucomicrobiia bacterium]
MKHIYKRGGSWYYQFTVKGKRFQNAIGEVSKAVAREVAEKKRVEALEGRLVERPIKAPLFGQYDAEEGQFTDSAEKYLDYYRQQHKPRSALRMHTAMVSLCRAFAGKRLDELHPFLIERYKTQRKEAGFADATVNRELACLKNMFNLAIKWGWVRDNPVRQVKLFRENNARLRWVTLDEETALLEHCDQRLKTFVLAAVDTGFRAGELLSLRWQDVNFQRGSVSVASGYTKNGEPRCNPMTKRLAQALQEWKAASKGSGDGLVFHDWRYREPFERARDAAKLGKDVIVHSLRHTYISRLIMAGADVRTVQELAGHKTITMTMRYAHLGPKQKRRAVEVLENEIAAEVTANLTTVDFGRVAGVAATGVS